MSYAWSDDTCATSHNSSPYTWILAGDGETCTHTCGNQSHTCSNGEWGVTGQGEFEAALIAADDTIAERAVTSFANFFLMPPVPPVEFDAIGRVCTSFTDPDTYPDRNFASYPFNPSITRSDMRDTGWWVNYCNSMLSGVLSDCDADPPTIFDLHQIPGPAGSSVRRLCRCVDVGNTAEYCSATCDIDRLTTTLGIPVDRGTDACTGDYMCQPGDGACPLTRCTPEQWESTQPTTDHRALVCADDPPTHTAAAPTNRCRFGPPTTVDRVCETLTPCTPEQWESTPPDPSNDRICSAISTACTAEQWESTAPGHSNDRACSAISTPCTAEQWESIAHGPSNDRVCSALTPCTPEQWESTAPGTSNDRICSALTTCAADQWESTTPDPTTDRVCTACTTQTGCATDGGICSAATGLTDKLICTSTGGAANYTIDADGTPRPCTGGTYTSAGENSCTTNTNCSGSWSACTLFCETAGDRTWTQTTAQSGNGAACPTTSDCVSGSGTCVINTGDEELLLIPVLLFILSVFFFIAPLIALYGD
jgi:hypothetical protein